MHRTTALALAALTAFVAFGALPSAAADEVTLCTASGPGQATCGFVCPAGRDVYIQATASGPGPGLVATGACGGAVATAGCVNIGINSAGFTCTGRMPGHGTLGVLSAAGGVSVTVRAYYLA